MKIEKSDDIVYPALFKVNSKYEVANDPSEHAYTCNEYNRFQIKHIGNLVPEIVYPAVFEDENKQQFMFFNEDSGFSYPDGDWLADDHKNMKHLYNAKIGRAD